MVYVPYTREKNKKFGPQRDEGKPNRNYREDDTKSDRQGKLTQMHRPNVSETLSIGFPRTQNRSAKDSLADLYFLVRKKKYVGRTRELHVGRKDWWSFAGRKTLP
jgi:hypothetical protein